MQVTAPQLEALYAELGVPLFRYLLGIVRDRGWAEDLVQDTFVRALKHPEPHLQRRGWWFTIARNLALNAVRDRRRKRERELTRGPASDPTEGPAERLLKEERDAGLRTALEGLDPTKREVLELRFYHDLTYAEIGAAMEIPEGTAKSRCHHGLRQLRERLEEERGGH